MSKALYRKYRSKTLDEVIGQKHITDILSQAIKTKRISHAYLFTGPRGVGKTSVARILAHEINESDYDEADLNLDIIEIDAASNNGVEDVRDLREKAQIAPVSGSKKIYIIDEVHMLSKQAFNALLKTLEEPPEHVVFILATTNLEKLPATIISRTQRFAFRPIGVEDISKHLSTISKNEKINISDEALNLIANRGDGSFRDSISLLDQLSSLIDTNQSEITHELIEQVLGLAPNELINSIIEAVETHDIELIVKTLNTAQNNGVDSGIIIDQILFELKNRIAKKPHLLPLFSALLNIDRHSHIDLKLISVLGIASSGKKLTKTVALSSTVSEITATVAELKKQSPKPKKIIKHTTKEKKAEIPVSTPEPAAPAGESKPFDWTTLLEHARKNYVAIFSVLSKCTHVREDNTLTLYTMNAFYKKKLDDTKHSPLLAKCLQEVGVYNLEIVTIPTPPPLKDSQAAAIAVIMGGGEEVKLES